MPEPDFSSLQEDLLRSGIARRQVRRTVAELRDHFEDLVERERERGAGAEAAARTAMRDLGRLEDIAMAVRARPELRSWAMRYPYVALVFYPLTCLALLPAIPILVGVAHAKQVGRWVASILLSGLVTTAIILMLQLSIALT